MHDDEVREFVLDVLQVSLDALGNDADKWDVNRKSLKRAIDHINNNALVNCDSGYLQFAKEYVKVARCGEALASLSEIFSVQGNITQAYNRAVIERKNNRAQEVLNVLDQHIDVVKVQAHNVLAHNAIVENLADYCELRNGYIRPGNTTTK